MPMDETKEEVPSMRDCLLPILIIEELVKSDKPMAVDNMRNKLGIGKAMLPGQFIALAEEGFIESYGLQTTYVASRWLATLSMDVL
ncbi:hypothetical protein [Loktanella sp. Alg231-35]|uniref:hypothetical protein n=1 Tax=Loktanella sp. Alg231-35 TaxID=1922220 RepID=UPI000D5547AE|nr:hypothetical protein [Loktanella sp. Alg231-35]